MNRNRIGCGACAVVAGWMMLFGCPAAMAQAQESAPAQPMTDISQIPSLESELRVSESAAVTFSHRAASREDLAFAAMRAQTRGMMPGAVAGGPKEQVVIRPPAESGPQAGGGKPVLRVPALSPQALANPPEEERLWKPPLPPLQSLEGR